MRILRKKVGQEEEVGELVLLDKYHNSLILLSVCCCFYNLTSLKLRCLIEVQSGGNCHHLSIHKNTGQDCQRLGRKSWRQ